MQKSNETAHTKQGSSTRIESKPTRQKTGNKDTNDTHNDGTTPRQDANDNERSTSDTYKVLHKYAKER